MASDHEDDEFPLPALQAWLKVAGWAVLGFGLWALWTLYPMLQ